MSTSRVTMLMQSNLFVNSIRNNTTDMFKVQNQLTTGLKLSRPSDSPAEATTIMGLDSQIERQNQYLGNIDHAVRVFDAADTALGNAIDLLQNAYDLASDAIGKDDATYKANAQGIQEIIDSLVTIGNTTSMGNYIFAGESITEMPFQSVSGGVMYMGDLNNLSARVADDSVANYTVDANTTFGSLSKGVIGVTSVGSVITEATRLSDLNGGLGEGIRLGQITISDGTNVDLVDLTGCETIGDVIDTINSSTVATTIASINSSGTGLTLTSTYTGPPPPPSVDVTVVETGAGTTAQDLGIFDSVGVGGDTLTGTSVGLRSSRLAPDSTMATLLSDMNGALGEGVRLGSILVSDGTNSAQIDLSGCVTLGDVINKIDANLPVNMSAIYNSANGGIHIESSDPASDITIKEVGSGYTARDLGIYNATGAGDALDSQDLDARLTSATPLSAVAGGVGIDTASGIIIQNSLLSEIDPIDISNCDTLGDVVEAINNAGIGALAQINAEGTGIEVINMLSGSELTIGENGGTTATDLGIRSMTGETTLASLNKGDGVATQVVGENGTTRDGAISITSRDGTSFEVNLSTAVTVQDVIDLINTEASAAGASVTASLASVGNGLVLTDSSGGAGNFEITTSSDNGYFVAAQLGFTEETSVASNTISAEDVNPSEPEGLFSSLIALHQAVLAGDDQGITKYSESVSEARQQLSNVHGNVGAQTKALEERRIYVEDSILATETLRSDIRDIDFTEALIRYQNLYTAMQANLMSAGQMNSLSLLEFLA